MKNFKALIEQHTNDGVIDYKTIEELVNKEINDTVAKNKPDTDKLIAESKDKWIAELGFQNVENEAQLKAYVKGTSDEWKEKYNELETKYKTDLDKYADYGSLQEKVNTYSNYELLRNKGITDPDTLEFLSFKVNKADGESFEDKLKAYEEAHPDTFQSEKKTVTTGVKIGIKPNPNEKLGFEKILEDKYGDL